MKKQCGKQIDENAPGQNFISSIISLQQSAESRYIKQKLAVLDSGKRQIQWIKSIYSHQGSNKKGAKAMAATWQAGGHGQRMSQDFL